MSEEHVSSTNEYGRGYRDGLAEAERQIAALEESRDRLGRELATANAGVVMERERGDKALARVAELEAEHEPMRGDDGDIICCGVEMEVVFIWDDPHVGYAFNLYACNDCGRLIKEQVWNNSGLSECLMDMPFPGSKKQPSSLTLPNGTVVRAGDVLVGKGLDGTDMFWMTVILVTGVGVESFLYQEIAYWPCIDGLPDDFSRFQSMQHELDGEDTVRDLYENDWRPWSSVYPDRPVPGGETIR